jgi:hypothetical protein
LATLVKASVVKRLRDRMTEAGFAEREVPSSGAFNFFFAKDFAVGGSVCQSVVRAVPSNVNVGEFHFETTLIMDGSVVTDTLQPAKFWGDVNGFLEKQVSLFGALFQMEDFYHRSPQMVEIKEMEG